MNAQAVIDPQNPDLYTNVNAVAWSPDGSLLALGSGFWGVPEGIEDYRVRVVNVATQQVIFTLPLLDRAQLIWSPSGENLYIGSLVDGILRYQVATGSLQASLAGRGGGDWYTNERMDLSPDGSRIAAIFTPMSGSYQEFTIYDAQTLQPLLSVNVNFAYEAETALSWVGYSPDGNLLATTGWDGFVRLWDANTLSQMAALITSPGKRLQGGDWIADGRLVVGGRDQYITVWNMITQQIINRIDMGSGFFYGLNSLRWHPDGRQIVLQGGEVWDSVTGQQVRAAIPNASAIDWSPSGVLAYGVSVDGRLEIPPNDNPLGSLISLATVPPLPPSR